LIADWRAGEGRALPACKLIEIQAHERGRMCKIELADLVTEFEINN